MDVDGVYGFFSRHHIRDDNNGITGNDVMIFPQFGNHMQERFVGVIAGGDDMGQNTEVK